ncbi:MAG: Cytosine-specific methyltransferase [Parcubacteria group bacterium GW2011_GWA2_33_14]|uniref:Cytosine-specific methyltransferase n=1 Tax=Candidatus Staskawiczbacteria bacterium RIFCSPHIGHO2_02_FULL_33_16 TaxID=1802204 RepID=A0A1G2HZ57_9BACT|nr:MAG: Cytosine-specific methyltransferase [Parcubacteria group bacterium GW2011_GWA2_33_14]OGZ67088.1 MAG: DNA (cytosine-5-)-methyltransferase [Candidatus Staskawiczbacteria bacterium RIFCSPHIGHO2_02_FULL_33_16]OGZ69982.1 MAG: DNA (cytosine-5-)-methyltransferase [Candidatus Staskawiczbacteria bacterium RIFCSPLOWO2_01_FULL_33_13]
MLKNIKNKLKAVSLFSGCGGLDRGFINAGFEIIWANDFFPDAVETYKKNISNHIILGDIKKIKSSQIPENFDILLGGFPCQGFSIANKKRNMKDERNFLYREMLRIVKDKKPPFFLAENVKGLLSMSGGEVIKMIKKDFESLGYIVDYKLVNAADYGVPQQRERVLILGNRLGIKNEFPESTHGKDKKPYITTKEVVGYLANVLVSFDPQKHNNKLVYNHIARTNVQDNFWGRKYSVSQYAICDYLKFWREKKGLSTKKIDDLFGYKYTAGHWFRKDNNSGSIPNPEDWWRLKKILEFDNKFDKQVTELELKPIKFEQSLRINNWDKPSDTITATGPEIHPNKKRRMSVRECAIIQTFPDNFVFTGSLGNMYKQIGNAVPVLLAQKIGKSIQNMIKKNRIYVN